MRVLQWGFPESVTDPRITGGPRLPRKGDSPPQQSAKPALQPSTCHPRFGTSEAHKKRGDRCERIPHVTPRRLLGRAERQVRQSNAGRDGKGNVRRS